jgi:hypothetical protein
MRVHWVVAKSPGAGPWGAVGVGLSMGAGGGRGRGGWEGGGPGLAPEGREIEHDGHQDHEGGAGGQSEEHTQKGLLGVCPSARASELRALASRREGSGETRAKTRRRKGDDSGGRGSRLLLVTCPSAPGLVSRCGGS